MDCTHKCTFKHESFDVSLEHDIVSTWIWGIHSASLNQQDIVCLYLWQDNTCMLHSITYPPPHTHIHTHKHPHLQAPVTPPNSASKDAAGGPTTRSSSRKRTRPSPYDRPNKSTRTTRSMEVRQRKEKRERERERGEGERETVDFTISWCDFHCRWLEFATLAAVLKMGRTLSWLTDYLTLN